jgi:hypothetical protein
MGRVTIDQALRSKLGSFESPLELCDETGRVVGHFIPVEDRSIYEGVESPVSNEELDRRLREESGRPLDDILRDLEGRQ